MDQTYLFVGGFVVLLAIYAVAFFLYGRRKLAKTEAWLKENPTATKIYCAAKNVAIVTNNITIHTVDGSPADHTFSEGTKYGIYILPGTHVIEASYTTSRPGVLYRNVSKTYGPLKLEVEISASNNYQLEFDKKTEEFSFTLVEDKIIK